MRWPFFGKKSLEYEFRITGIQLIFLALAMMHQVADDGFGRMIGSEENFFLVIDPAAEN